MNIKLKNAREKQYFTQAQVAECCHISTRQYQRIEAREQKPNVDTAMKIAELLGSTVEELFSN